MARRTPIGRSRNGEYSNSGNKRRSGECGMGHAVRACDAHRKSIYRSVHCVLIYRCLGSTRVCSHWPLNKAKLTVGYGTVAVVVAHSRPYFASMKAIQPIHPLHIPHISILCVHPRPAATRHRVALCSTHLVLTCGSVSAPERPPFGRQPLKVPTPDSTH